MIEICQFYVLIVSMLFCIRIILPILLKLVSDDTPKPIEMTQTQQVLFLLSFSYILTYFFKII